MVVSGAPSRSGAVTVPADCSQRRCPCLTIRASAVPQHAWSALRLLQAPPGGREDGLFSLLRRPRLFLPSTAMPVPDAAIDGTIPHAPPDAVGPRRHRAPPFAAGGPSRWARTAWSGEREIGYHSRCRSITTSRTTQEWPGRSHTARQGMSTWGGLSGRCRPRATRAPDGRALCGKDHIPSHLVVTALRPSLSLEIVGPSSYGVSCAVQTI